MATEYAGMFSQVRVSFVIASSEDERPLEAVSLTLSGARCDKTVLRCEIEELVSACLTDSGAPATKPVITEHDGATSRGGGAMVHVVEYLVWLGTAAAAGVVGNTAFDGLKRLRNEFSLSRGPQRSALLALDAQEAHRIAAEAISEKFGVPRVQLRPVSMGFDGPEGQVVFQAKDGSTFIVNIDNTNGGRLNHVLRIWPTEQDEGDLA